LHCSGFYPAQGSDVTLTLRLRAGIAALAEVCRNETGIAERSANVAPGRA